MKRMICYFLLCALVLSCIAGCISKPPVSTPTDGATDPSGSESLENPTNSQGTQQVDPDFTIPEIELEPLPTIDREDTGLLVEYDPDRELYILTGINDIIYEDLANNRYGFRIYSKESLDVTSISVKLPISSYYSVSISQKELGGVQEVGANNRMDEQQYSSGTFTYPLYLAYKGKDFRKLAELKHKADQLQEMASEYEDMYLGNQIDYETYLMMCEPYLIAHAQYQDYLNAEWEEYLNLTKDDLPQFYVYAVTISFLDRADFGSEQEQEVSFTQIEVTIGDKTYVQDVGKVTLIEDWELPAPLDWETAYDATAGIMGSANTPRLYNDGIHCIEVYFHFVADRYKLLEELVMLNPAQTVERVWLRVRPKGGNAIMIEWDMSEPYEIYPGDDVTVYAAYRDESLNTLGYQTATDAYLLYTTDGESYCKFSGSWIGTEESDYLYYAILFDGIDMESYYWDYYYLFNEPWRYDPEATPVH